MFRDQPMLGHAPQVIMRGTTRYEACVTKFIFFLIFRTLDEFQSLYQPIRGRSLDKQGEQHHSKCHGLQTLASGSKWSRLRKTESQCQSDCPTQPTPEQNMLPFSGKFAAEKRKPIN